MKNIAPVLRDAYTGWKKDNASRLAAALSYYTIFAIVPLLIITISVVGLVFGRQAAEGQIVAQIGSIVGSEAAEFIQEAIQTAGQKEAGLFATLVGPVTLILGAIGVVGHLKESLNAIWNVEPPKGRGIISQIQNRVLSLGMVLGVGFLLMVSFVLSAVVQALAGFLDSIAPGMPLMIQIGNFAVSFLVTTVLFAAIFRVLPDRHIRWDDVWFGAIVTSILFSIGRQAIGIYLGTAGTGSAYGAAGSLVVLLVWIYYSSLILFTGAEITQAYAEHHHPEDAPAKQKARATSESNARTAAPRGVTTVATKAAPPIPPAPKRPMNKYGEKPGPLGYALSIVVFGALFALSKVRQGKEAKPAQTA